ncbi:DUF2141 domain-containing protein [Sandaracinus amylolyticus]|uniref:DUF2141 domain-containing protein n=1 Tax=Sandaracinus amylolyticus TaxID=927083 RepID=UPI00146FF321|nr:DUF2141 domain-containing protein [Sandaracinus amylolyticus]
MNKRASAVSLGVSMVLVLTLFAGSALGQQRALVSRLTGTPAPASETLSLVFRVRGLRSDRGQVMGALFDRPERWVRAGEEVAACHVRIRGREARCELTVRPGRYAFAFAHDEDGDGRFDRDFLGIPQEGYGFSNNVRPSLSLPSFQSAAFAFREAPSGELVVTTRYGI